MARKNVQPQRMLERGAASDLWRNTLAQIPSVYGRLAYLSRIRDPNTGRYEHHGLALVFGDKEADRAMRESHMTAFREWLEFTLEQQKADLDLYLSEQVGIKKHVIENWLQLQPYKNVVPAKVSTTDRRLFLADLEALLALLKNETGAAGPDPDA